VPQPTIVWLWRPGADRGLRGTLTLGGDVLRFEADRGDRLGIPLGDLRRARRHRATPVIELDYLRDGERRVALLFFARPPSMADRATRSGPFATMFGMARGTRRAAAMVGLRGANRHLRPVVREWAEAVGA
jgi:hypothetical protein